MQREKRRASCLIQVPYFRGITSLKHGPLRTLVHIGNFILNPIATSALLKDVITRGIGAKDIQFYACQWDIFYFFETVFAKRYTILRMSMGCFLFFRNCFRRIVFLIFTCFLVEFLGSRSDRFPRPPLTQRLPQSQHGKASLAV